MSFDSFLAETADNLYDALLASTTIDDVARVVAGGFRGECLQVRAPGVPFGEYIAAGADWWAGQASDFLSPFVDPVRREHERVTTDLQDFLGIDTPGPFETDARPRFSGFGGPPDEGFLVQVPGYEDLFTFNNEFVFDDRSRRERSLDYFDSLQQSPTPPSFREAAEILTALDDIQDEAATLTTALALVSRVAGRSIPGIGQIALAADVLDILGAVTRPGTLSSFPGLRGKRQILDKARSSRNSYAGRVEEQRRFLELDSRARGDLGPRLDPGRPLPRDFRLGWGDAVQALQATDSLFGTGVQLGPVVGFLQDAFWGVVRGATFQARGPLWDPLGFTEAGRAACFRSPTLDEVHPQAYYFLANTALHLWSQAGRVFPWLPFLPEQALASTLLGLRASENALGPWLRKGGWVGILGQMLQDNPTVPGGVESVDTRRIPVQSYLARTGPATTTALNTAISNVADRGRQALYEELASAFAWGVLGSLEPGVRIAEQRIVGAARDGFLLLEANRVPAFDLED